MPRFMIERDFGQISEEQMEDVALRSDRLITERFPDVVWEHSHVVADDEGAMRTFCVYEAPDEATVRRHAEFLGDHAISRLYEIAADVTPRDLPR